MSDLVKRCQDAQKRVAAGSLDLRDVGKVLFGIWDQDLIAELVTTPDRIEALKLENKRLREALKTARQFIQNSIEVGYLRMPDGDDPASQLPDLINAALGDET
jgi:hypothetical protein